MKKQLIVVWDALLARNGVVAYMPIIVVTILMFCGASWQIFWPSTDAARYQCYALVFWLGGGATQLLPVSQCAFLHAPTRISSTDTGNIFSVTTGAHFLLSTSVCALDGAHLHVDLLAITPLRPTRSGFDVRAV